MKLTREQLRALGWDNGKATRKRKSRGSAGDGKTGNNPIFDALCKAHGVPCPTSEYRFCPPRRWRFDHCWATEMVALEVQGGLFSGGRHVRGAALVKEQEKLNAAACLGWRVIYCTPEDIESGAVFPLIAKALRGDE